MTEAERQIGRCCAAGFEDGNFFKRHHTTSRKCRWTLEPRKDKESFFPKAVQRNAILPMPYFRIFDLQTAR